MAVFEGTNGDDAFHGGSADDSVQGWGGNDMLFGNGGNDSITGGHGEDTLDGGDGDDRLASDEVVGTFSDFGPSQDYFLDHDILNGGAGSDRLFAGYGDDVDGGSGIDYLSLNFSAAPSGVNADFSLGSVTIAGGTISNVENLMIVVGSNYDDYIRAINSAPGSADMTIEFGMGGNDTLVAGSYASKLDGGEGDDLLISGAGADNLSGGPGNDVFLGQATSLDGDTITDFTRGDSIVISDAAITNFTFQLSGNQLAYAGGSLALANIHNASITASAAPDGGVLIAFGGPPIIFAAGAFAALASSGSASQSAEMVSPKVATASDAVFPDHQLRVDQAGWHDLLGWAPAHPMPADLFAFG
jgi:Ca2+-binding RTX toxin-like protein